PALRRSAHLRNGRRMEPRPGPRGHGGDAEGRAPGARARAVTGAVVAELPSTAKAPRDGTGTTLDEVLRARVLPATTRPELEAAAGELQAAGAGEVLGIVFFGSRRTQAARADVHSAHDMFVVVRRYRAAYAALRRSGKIGKRPWLLAALNHVLPPNQISLR